MQNVWIIEDNEGYRDSTLRGLRAIEDARSYSGFNSCEDAIAEIQDGAVPDVILMDIGLPGMDGIEGIGEIKQRVPESSILILTVFEDDDKIFRALQAGASGYLLKSESISKVSEAVELAFQGSAPIHPRIAGRVLKMFAELSPVKQDHGLSDRERAVLECMARGLVRKQTAIAMDMNMHTVDYVTRRIYSKLHVNGATAAVAFAIRERIIDPPEDIME